MQPSPLPAVVTSWVGVRAVPTAVWSTSGVHLTHCQPIPKLCSCLPFGPPALSISHTASPHSSRQVATFPPLGASPGFATAAPAATASQRLSARGGGENSCGQAASWLSLLPELCLMALAPQGLGQWPRVELRHHRLTETEWWLSRWGWAGGRESCLLSPQTSAAQLACPTGLPAPG